MRIGFTLGCPGCRAISRNAPAQNHTEECRERLERELTKEGGHRAKKVAEGNQRYCKRRNDEKTEGESDNKKQTVARDPNRQGGDSGVNNSSMPGSSTDERITRKDKHMRDEEPITREQRNTRQRREEATGIKRDRLEQEDADERPHKYVGTEEDEERDAHMEAWINVARFTRKDNVNEFTREDNVDPIKEEEVKEIWDEMSGKPLCPGKVRKARSEELGELAKHQVYDIVPETECWRVTGKAPVGTRWIDINKGDEVNPDYRSRLVAQEINDSKREDLFAATPPLEAKNCCSHSQ